MSARILGIDISTRNTGIVMFEPGWFSPDGPDWTKVSVHSIELESVSRTAPEMVRCRRLWQFSQQFPALLVRLKPTNVWLEQYAFGRMDAYARLTAEITGCVKIEVMRRGLNVNVVHSASARKLVLGKVPRGEGEAKKQTREFWNQLGLEGDDNITDAATVANYGMGECHQTVVSGGVM